jgi:hypothetical protein
MDGDMLNARFDDLTRPVRIFFPEASITKSKSRR